MIREFEIWNRKFNTLEGHLYFNTETEEFRMTVEKQFTDKVDALFMELNKRGIYEVPQHITNKWVQSRVPPPYRQGIKGMLAQSGMKEYHLPSLFFWCMGACEFDYSYCKEVTR